MQYYELDLEKVINTANALGNLMRSLKANKTNHTKFSEELKRKGFKLIKKTSYELKKIDNK